MRFHWTKESFGYALRDARGYARSIITFDGGTGFYGQILAPGLPDSGPYYNAVEAAAWVQCKCVELCHLPEDSEFSALPVKAGKAAA